MSGPMRAAANGLLPIVSARRWTTRQASMPARICESVGFGGRGGKMAWDFMLLDSVLMSVWSHSSSSKASLHCRCGEGLLAEDVSCSAISYLADSSRRDSGCAVLRSEALYCQYLANKALKVVVFACASINGILLLAHNI